MLLVVVGCACQPLINEYDDDDDDVNLTAWWLTVVNFMSWHDVKLPRADLHVGICLPKATPTAYNRDWARKGIRYKKLLHYVQAWR